MSIGHCSWAFSNEMTRAYHDTEWGIPVHDDRQMFEHLTLECLQCGLSWGLMMKKREIFRACFDNFEFDKIAAYDESDVQRILNTEGMLRSDRKVRAVINNARCYQKLWEEYGSFCDWLWSFSDGKTIMISWFRLMMSMVQMTQVRNWKLHMRLRNPCKRKMGLSLKRRSSPLKRSLMSYQRVQTREASEDGNGRQRKCWRR